MNRIKLFVLVTMVVHFVDSAGAQQVKSSPRLTPLLGVYDAKTGEPIEGAVVRDTLGNSARTSKDGAVALNYVQPMITKKGWYYLIEIRKENYSPLRLEISADSLGDRTETLVPNPLGGDGAAQLPAVVTTARASITNLEAHGRAGAKVISPGVLREKEYESMSIGEALRKNGISIYDLKTQLDSEKRIRGGRSQGNDCPVSVLLNGSPIGASMLVRYDDQASRYDGVEYYKPHTDVPSEFKQLTNPCGVIIFWTQAR